MLRMAVQAKGRLNEESIALLKDAGINVATSKRKLLARASEFPIEILYLRDDDIPQAVAMGVADVGIVGLNEVAEKAQDVNELMRLGFGGCRISLAVPRDAAYTGPQWFEGKRIATSYPKILTEYFQDQKVNAHIHEMAGSVEIAPAVGMADGIFDIVSSGSTLVQNGLVEVEQVFQSEAILIARNDLDEEKLADLEKLKFRLGAIIESRGMKYVLLNLPYNKLDEAVALIPGMRSPTVVPLAAEGWCSLHVVIPEREIWERIEQLKALGAEGILVVALENMIR